MKSSAVPLLAAGMLVTAVILILAQLLHAVTLSACLAALLIATAATFLCRSYITTKKRLRALALRAESISARPARDDQQADEIARTLSVLERIAPRLERSLAELEHADQMRRDFVANVSHELRTPLASIQGYAETLLDSARANTAEHEFLEVIRRNALRMSRLTEDLLTLARVESGEQQFSFVSIAVADVLHDAVAAFQQVAVSKGIQLEIEQIAPWAVRADPEALHQVFANLIQNAMNYSASGRIVVGAHERAQVIEFYVRDFGAGISPEHLPRLFERFYRVDAARSREVGGTGLGLAIAKHVILAHGGEIRVESTPRQGTTFYFTLPIAGGFSS